MKNSGLHGLKPIIKRVGTNAHRYLVLINGRFRCFTMSKKEIAPFLASLFGALNQCLPDNRQVYGRLIASLLTLSILLSGPAAFALPTGWEVVSGDVSFEQQGSILNVSSATQSAIVNYQSFNIAQGEAVNFNFLLNGSSILNRIIGGGASNIAGAMSGNGRILLVNPAGINIAGTANINTGSLMASTLNIQNADFLAGKYIFSKDAAYAPAAINNDGHIKATDADGHVILLGSAVKNAGTIEAPKVALAVGDKITVNADPNMTLKVTVDEALKEKVENYQSAIENTGAIDVTQQAELQASIEGQLYQSVVNNSGRVQAASVIEDQTGTIAFMGKGGDVINSGEVVADATSGGNAGTIDISATGNTVLEDGSLISANGGENGNGGNIRIWADGDTNFEHGAKIDVSGGAQSGNGGFAEVSAKNTVFFNGQATGYAGHGEGGRILIDPTDIRITTGGPLGSASVAFGDANNNGTESIFGPDQFVGFQDVNLQATNNIVVETNWNLSDITSGHNLTLEAGNNININGAVSTGGGNINLFANHDFSGAGGPAASGTGTVNIFGAGSLNAQGGSINLSGHDGIFQGNISTSGTGTIDATFTNDISLSANIQAVDGTITLTADSDLTNGGDFTIANGNMVSTNDGIINISGDSALLNSGGTISSITGNGDITISATGTDAGDKILLDSFISGSDLLFNSSNDIQITPLFNGFNPSSTMTITAANEINADESGASFGPVDAWIVPQITINADTLRLKTDGSFLTMGGTINVREAFIESIGDNKTVQINSGFSNQLENLTLTASGNNTPIEINTDLSASGQISFFTKNQVTVANGVTVDAPTIDIDTPRLDLLGTLDAGTGTVTITNTTGGTQVIGGTSADDLFNFQSLSTAELNRITAGKLVFGSTLGSNLVRVEDTLDMQGTGAGKFNLDLNASYIQANDVGLLQGNHLINLNAANNIDIYGSNAGIPINVNDITATFMSIQSLFPNAVEINQLNLDGFIIMLLGDNSPVTVHSDVFGSVGANILTEGFNSPILVDGDFIGGQALLYSLHSNIQVNGDFASLGTSGANSIPVAGIVSGADLISTNGNPIDPIDNPSVNITGSVSFTSDPNLQFFLLVYGAGNLGSKNILSQNLQYNNIYISTHQNGAALNITGNLTANNNLLIETFRPGSPINTANGVTVSGTNSRQIIVHDPRTLTVASSAPPVPQTVSNQIGNILTSNSTNSSNPLTSTVDSETADPFTSGNEAPSSPNNGLANNNSTLKMDEDSDSVSVLDAETQAILATLKVGNGPIAYVKSPDGGTAYVANFGDGTISVIDLNAKQVTNTIEVGIQPTSIILSDDGKTLLVYSETDNAILTVDIEHHEVLGKTPNFKEKLGLALSMKSKPTSASN